MPYIDPEQKLALDQGSVPTDPGQLNYVLTRECIRYLEQRAVLHKDQGGWTGGLRPSYEDRAEVLNALEAAKLEFYRRALAPYEDDKKVENGDVYPEWLTEPRWEGETR